MYDVQLQSNHPTHFLLTAKLFPLLVAEVKHHGGVRVIQHSSGAREMTVDNRLEEGYFGKDQDDFGGDRKISVNIS